jgi:hypothetical protein
MYVLPEQIYFIGWAICLGLPRLSSKLETVKTNMAKHLATTFMIEFYGFEKRNL